MNEDGLLWACRYYYLVDYTDENLRLIPEEARAALAEAAVAERDAAFGRHPTKGWFVLSTGGQDPTFEWTEWDNE